MPSPFLESIRRNIHFHSYNIGTEKPYLCWIRCFMRHQGNRQPPPNYPYMGTGIYIRDTNSPVTYTSH